MLRSMYENCFLVLVVRYMKNSRFLKSVYVSLVALSIVTIALVLIISKSQFAMRYDITQNVANRIKFSKQTAISASQHAYTHFMSKRLVKRTQDYPIIEDIVTPDTWKSLKWYLSAIEKLPFQKIVTTPLHLESSYFHPNSKTRFEIVDEELMSPSGCSDNIRLVVLTLSEMHQVELRKAIRSTWGSVAYGQLWPWVGFTMDIKLIFVVGVRSNGSKNSWPERELKTEAETYKDILQLSTIDRYRNLTRKMISSFRWIHTYCSNIRYVIKADQDVFVNTPMIWQFLMHYGKKNSIYGFVYSTGRVSREGRWALSKSAYPLDEFPAYMSGISYVISFDAIAKVLETYYLFPYIGVEDVFVTGIVATVAKIDRYNVQGFAHWQTKTPNHCQLVTDKIYTANDVNAAKLRSIWRSIQRMGDGKCELGKK